MVINKFGCSKYSIKLIRGYKMDPITHAVIGVTVSKIAGSNVELSNAAQMGIIVGSVFPDVDILLQKWGDYVYLKNHRGATHSIVGLLTSAVVITAALAGIYKDSHIISIFLWTLLGLGSHSFFDLFNAYGAKLLWPFSNKKFTWNLLIVFDPVFLLILLGFIFSSGSYRYEFMGLFGAYLAALALLRYLAKHKLEKRFDCSCERISILPSISGLFKWHFVLETDELNIVGQKKFFNKEYEIIKTLPKVENPDIDRAAISPVGKFFNEFTPLSHITHEKVGELSRYTFTDMRYYVKNNFLHHAVLEMDDNDNIINASFNPYSMKRRALIPLNEHAAVTATKEISM